MIAAMTELSPIAQWFIDTVGVNPTTMNISIISLLAGAGAIAASIGTGIATAAATVAPALATVGTAIAPALGTAAAGLGEVAAAVGPVLGEVAGTVAPVVGEVAGTGGGALSSALSGPVTPAAMPVGGGVPTAVPGVGASATPVSPMSAPAGPAPANSIPANITQPSDFWSQFSDFAGNYNDGPMMTASRGMGDPGFESGLELGEASGQAMNDPGANPVKDTMGDAMDWLSKKRKENQKKQQPQPKPMPTFAAPGGPAPPSGQFADFFGGGGLRALSESISGRSG